MTPMAEDITVRLTRGEPGPALIEAAQEIRQLRNYVAALREENERLRVKLEGFEPVDTGLLCRAFGVADAAQHDHWE